MPQSTRIVTQIDRHGPLEIQEIELPDPAPNEVLVEIEATGVCQSQVFWLSQPRQQPVLFGHEGYGRVLKVGESVTDLAEGDHVLVTWLPRTDPSGRAAQVAEATLANGSIGRSPNVYTWAEHALVDELYVYRLSGEEAPETSVAACAVLTGAGAVVHAPVDVAGKAVAVIGAGGVGLSAVAAAHERGASDIYVLDLADDKLEFARRFGATETINVTSMASEDVLAAVAGGVDLVVDCVASGPTVNQAIGLARPAGAGRGPGGVVSLVGLPKGSVEIDLASVVFGQKTLVGTLAGSCAQDDLDEFLRWHREGSFDLTELVTDRYAFDDVAGAVEDLVAGRVRGRAILLRK